MKSKGGKMLSLHHGDKGGVGKSFECSVHLDALLVAGKKDKVIVVESDTRNPDVARVFQSHFRLEQIDLKLHDGWMTLVDLLADHKDHEIVVSLPAGIGHFLEEESEFLVTALQDLGHGLKVFWPINRLKDSIILLMEFLKNPLSDHAEEIIVCLNGFFGEQKKFYRWNDSKTRKEFLARKGCREIYLPELHERVVDSVAGPFSLAFEELRYSERTELQRWLKQAHAAVMGG
jgi:hypothetical protein